MIGVAIPLAAGILWTVVIVALVLLVAAILIRAVR
jgi:hypothetical protein